MQPIEKGMRISDLSSPAILLDLDVLERNVREVGDLVKRSSKELWPMAKTHKSLEIAQMQIDAGATGFLCGTVEEAELLAGEGGYKELILAYPQTDPQNLARCIALLDRAHLIFRLDSERAASLLNEALEAAGKTADCQIKIDSGLHRFGVAPQKATALANSVGKLKNVNLIGIGSHTGSVYTAGSPEEVRTKSLEALECLHIAYDDLKKNGREIEMVTMGSTPSLPYDLEDDLITAVHPGNYVYYDAMQVAFGSTTQENCALSVLITVTSKHAERGTAAINAGSKILSRDIGGHGTEAVKGYGMVKGHPKAVITSISEEVGLMDIHEESGIEIGSKIFVIPNHACSVNTQTNYLIGYRDGVVEKAVKVDARVGN